jgi:hypothetical protein
MPVQGGRTIEDWMSKLLQFYGRFKALFLLYVFCGSDGMMPKHFPIAVSAVAAL